jgi:hypothetical protein
MDYKSTLNLPRTDFPMRANLPQREPEILARWEAIDLYRKLQEASAGKPRFVLHDGPPYANGHIHIGHTLNKVLKDIIVKYRAMTGWQAPYIPGWDCHGLPIELQVEKELGRAKKEAMPKVEVHKRCRAYAEKFVGVQRQEFKRLGVLGDWERRTSPWTSPTKRKRSGCWVSIEAASSAEEAVSGVRHARRRWRKPRSSTRRRSPSVFGLPPSSRCPALADLGEVRSGGGRPRPGRCRRASRSPASGSTWRCARGRVR